MEKVVVSIADDELDQISQVVAAVREAGMEVDDVLESLGMVTGSVHDQGAISSLQAIPGVADVERQRTVQLPPPDSPS